MSGVSCSIILLSYNAADLLPITIRALTAMQGPKAEVIVIDNASEDGSAEIAAEHSRRNGWTYHRLETNIGYARGMNLGLGMASGQLLVPLNCDAVLDSSFLMEAARAIHLFPDAGAFGPHVSRPANDGKTEEDDGSVISLQAGMRVRIRPHAASGVEIFKPNGCAPALRRSALEQLGNWPEVFDPTFDTYGEDVDLALRLWAAGWRIRYVPGMKVIHNRSRGLGYRMWMKRGRHRRNLFRGRWFNALMHSPMPYLARDLLLVAAQDVGVALLQSLRGDLAVLSDVSAAWRDVIRGRTRLRKGRQARLGRLQPNLYRHLTRLP